MQNSPEKFKRVNFKTSPPSYGETPPYLNGTLPPEPMNFHSTDGARRRRTVSNTSHSEMLVGLSLK